MEAIRAMGATFLALLSLILVFGLFSIANIVFGIERSNQAGVKFCWKKLWKGIKRSMITLLGVIIVCLAVTLLPVINAEIADLTGTVLIDAGIMDSLSAGGLYASIIAGISIQGKKAISNMIALFKNQKDDSNTPSI